MIKNLIVIFVLIFLSTLQSQTIRVFSKDDSIPIPSTHIVIKDLKKASLNYPIWVQNRVSEIINAVH